MSSSAAVDNFVAAKASNINKVHQRSTSRPQSIQQQALRIHKNPLISTSAGIWFATRGSQVRTLSRPPNLFKDITGGVSLVRFATHENKESSSTCLLAMIAAISCVALPSPGISAEPKVISFRSGDLTLHGTLYKPEGRGPFPAVVYNHGSAPGMLSKQAFEALGPVFASHGWVFFGPYRRGQGLSASAGPYIGDEIAAAEKKGGITAAAETMVRLLEKDHLDDQLAALAWLRTQPFVKQDRIAVAGNSFGGIEAVLGAERGSYCAAIDSAGAAQSWAQAPEVQVLMTRAVRNSRVPIFFFQAENDYDLSPSRVLSVAMKDAGKEFQVKIYPRFGNSVQDGHSFGYFGGSVWGPDVFQFLE
jgi:carboxymethylenebutenolidase